MRVFSRLLGLLFILALAAGACAAWDAWSFLHTPPQTPGRDVVVDIAPGSGLRTVADALEATGAVSDALRFTLLARVQAKEQKIQTGRFLINTGWLPQKVLDQVVSGQAMLFRVTVPEGKTWWETAAIMEAAGLCRAEDFSAVAHDPEFLRHWGIPFANAEGFLFPDTYFMPRPRELDERAARSAADRMLDNFWKRTGPIWGEGRPDVATLTRTITLASIVEKETGVSSERARVAGVYANRLSRNMLLQADPTVIYGLGPAFSGSLRRSQLNDESNVYNTYERAGLPPGPICSPGEAALRAAAAPESHNFLYFVASGQGASHVFSTNLEQHNRAVREYRAALRNRGN